MARPGALRAPYFSMNEKTSCLNWLKEFLKDCGQEEQPQTNTVKRIQRYRGTEVRIEVRGLTVNIRCIWEILKK